MGKNNSNEKNQISVSVCEEIRRFITENFLIKAEELVEEEDSLLEKGIIDSTGVLELIAFIEDKFAITVEDEEMVPENLDSIRNIEKFIQGKIGGTAEPKLREGYLAHL